MVVVVLVRYSSLGFFLPHPLRDGQATEREKREGESFPSFLCSGWWPRREGAEIIFFKQKEEKKEVPRHEYS